MKFSKALSIVFALVLIFGTFGAANAQLGEEDVSSFTVQNAGSGSVTVTVTFVEEDGDEITPNPLNRDQPNPFTLDEGESFEVYVPGIPDLPDGRYSVYITSTGPIVAIANLLGEGDVFFNGSYSGFSSGANPFYLGSFVYNYYGWYSMISVQNVGSSDANVTVTMTCEDGTIGTLQANSIPKMASHHFVLKDTKPTGFPTGKSCNGSVKVSANQNIVVVDNQNKPAAGNTQSFSGVPSGSDILYVPALYHQYYGWDASVNILKLGSGTTTVTVAYSDGGSDQCTLDDTVPGCLLYMPAVHPGTGYFGAKITHTNTAGVDLVAVANASNGNQAQTYNAVGNGSQEVSIPSVMKNYYSWNSSFTCQNNGTINTTLEIMYDGYPTYDYTTGILLPGDTLEIYTPDEGFLPNGHQGGATVEANATGAEIVCIANFTNPFEIGDTVGDWSMSYNAFNK